MKSRLLIIVLSLWLCGSGAAHDEPQDNSWWWSNAWWQDGILEVPEGWTYAPDILQFYEAESDIEQELWIMFLKHRMRTFQGVFHSNPDYTHWYGWAAMKESLRHIKDEAARLRAEAAAE